MMILVTTATVPPPALLWSVLVLQLARALADVQRDDANQLVWLATVGEAWVCLMEHR
jgi:hypothetical protein